MESGLDALIEGLRHPDHPSAPPVAITFAPGLGAGLTGGGPARSHLLVIDRVAPALARIDHELAPRWVTWSQSTATALAQLGVELGRGWDLAAVHRLLAGGSTADPARVWARARGLDPAAIAELRPVDLFTDADEEGDEHDPIRPDGHLRADWAAGAWATDPTRLLRWSELALTVAVAQQETIDAGETPTRTARTARSESSAELLCAELAHHGLPVDRDAMEDAIASFIGPRPTDERHAARLRAARDDEVLALVPPGGRFDLRSPGQVRSLLRFVGIEVPDTRAWRLEQLTDAHPVVPALLAWRRAERTETTFGYTWLDRHLGPDGRLRGEWTGCDGAAGRMTASAGLHNMPAELRSGVVAEPGHVFVRADLGQVEPRVLAAVSGDPALIAATAEPDLYARVAAQLGVDRATAKLAVLGAMYGQTTGLGARAMVDLRTSYPVAIAHLDAAARTAEAGGDLRTHGGRRIPTAHMGGSDRSQVAARGRFGRNAVIQGAAAELFKVWALTVRTRAAHLGARIVLCLHDELLVHTPVAQAEATARVVDDALAEAAHRWAPDSPTRFVTDTSIITTWANAEH